MAAIEKDFGIRDFNTFRIPVRSKYFATFRTDDQLREILAFVRREGLRFYVIGSGANILFTGDFDGMLIHPLSGGMTTDGCVMTADAGVIWDDLVAASVSAGLGGLENLSLIPGTVGAAPVQNIGAYGAEAKDTVLWVEYMDTGDCSIHRIDGASCGFGYRDSVFKHGLSGRAVILRVAFGLTPADASYRYRLDYGALKTVVDELGGPSLANVREATMRIRRSKLPDPAVTGNAGSFFRNPEVTSGDFARLQARFPDTVGYPLPSGMVKVSAGWLIEKAGWKGKSLGRAAVHDRQALVLVNSGGAAGEDILRLCRKVREDVKAMSGIDLAPEVIIL